MPRIDPVQLLNCLGVLLSPNGGIRSNEEVHRLVSLMTKFSKKLVSKCIYIQILKCTETELLGSFMGLGGWRLVHMWLTESIVAKNWPLVRELLELLLLCPVDIERLKTNNCPKLVKELSKDGSQAAIRALAAKLVEQWLKTVKGEPVVPVAESDIPIIISEAIASTIEEKVYNGLSSETNNIEENVLDKRKEETENRLGEDDIILHKNELHEDETLKSPETVPPLKISLKDVKPIASGFNEGKENKEFTKTVESSEEPKSSKSKSQETKSSHSKHSTSSKSYSSSKSSKDKTRSSSGSSKSYSSSSSKDKHRDSNRHSSSSDKHKDRKSSDKSSKSSSSDRPSKLSNSDRPSSKSKNEKSQSDKNKDDKSIKDKSVSSKDTNPKNKDNGEKAQSIHKLMKIPKISEAPKKDAPSISIESRKPNDPNRPKTVKTFNSKFRSHGLEEEAKPPPSRSTVLKKVSSAIPPAVTIPKRPSPTHGSDQPPEKKQKMIEPAEKPGSIKLIPAKPKPALLLESDMFMDALNASATNKKDPKKRKRRTSGSKDSAPGTEASPPTTPTSAASVTSPSRETKSAPFQFYKDTLEEEEKEKEPSVQTEDAEPKREEDAHIEESDSHVHTNADGLKGVLCYHKRKGPKKSIRWLPDAELEQIQYFELDETERVNVSKTFSDMKNMERIHEREAVQKARNLLNDDVMEVRTTWRGLIPVDCGEAIVVEYGKNSKEKEIQAGRQKSVLQSIYLKAMTPDSPSEPDTESHSHSEPTMIPLDDVTGNPDTVSDFRNTPWPEPKGSCPTSSAGAPVVPVVPPMFPPMSQFPGPFPNGQFPVPGYQSTAGAGMPPPHGDWTNGLPPNVMVPGAMPPGPMGPMPPGIMINPNMPPGMIMPPDSMMSAEMFGAPPGQNMFPMPDSFNMNGPPHMFPPRFPGGPPGPVPDSAGAFSAYVGRGGMRGRGSSCQWRGGWDSAGRGRGGQGGWKKAKCIHFMKKGSCRQGDSCAFMHPGVNCPY